MVESDWRGTALNSAELMLSRPLARPCRFDRRGRILSQSDTEYDSDCNSSKGCWMPRTSSCSTNTSINIHEDETGETPKSGCQIWMWACDGPELVNTVRHNTQAGCFVGIATLQGTYGSVLLVGDRKYVVAREHIAYVQDQIRVTCTHEHGMHYIYVDNFLRNLMLFLRNLMLRPSASPTRPGPPNLSILHQTLNPQPTPITHDPTAVSRCLTSTEARGVSWWNTSKAMICEYLVHGLICVTQMSVLSARSRAHSCPVSLSSPPFLSHTLSCYMSHCSSHSHPNAPSPPFPHPSIPPPTPLFHFLCLPPILSLCVLADTHSGHWT